MVARKGRRVVTKPVAILLRRILDGEVAAVLVLADYLESESLPLAKLIRLKVAKHQQDVEYWKTADMSRRKRARHEVIGQLDRSLRRGVMRAFGEVTTSVGPKEKPMSARIVESARRLTRSRKRINKLEGSAENSAKRLLKAARRHYLVILVPFASRRSCTVGEIVGPAVAGRLAVVVVRKRIAGYYLGVALPEPEELEKAT